VTAIRAITDAVQAQATPAGTGGVRFFVAANQEGGLIQALKGSGFSTIPTAVDQGALDPTLLQTHAATWGRQLRAAGINLNFAPVFDVVPPGAESQNQPIGVLNREYGHDPMTVASHATAFVRGMAASGIATTAKHFPGLGRVVGNTDFTADVVDTVTTATDPYLASFKAAIASGVPFVMVAIATYQRIDPDRLAAFSPIVVTQLLRDQLGFRGVIVSDDLGATVAVASIPPADRAIDFLDAGGDLIISKTVAPAIAMAQAVTARVVSDAGFKTRVDEAALEVLRAKQAFGLLPCS
jgi:beta-N-acetylhexosaminidase